MDPMHPLATRNRLGDGSIDPLRNPGKLSVRLASEKPSELVFLVRNVVPL
jgi:hypothetical protein